MAPPRCRGKWLRGHLFSSRPICLLHPEAPSQCLSEPPSLVLVKLLSFKAFLCLHLRRLPPPLSPPHTGLVASEDSHHPGPPLVPCCHSLPESPALLDFEPLLTLTLLKRPLRASCSPPHIPPMCLTPQCRPLFSMSQHSDHLPLNMDHGSNSLCCPQGLAQSLVHGHPGRLINKYRTGYG